MWPHLIVACVGIWLMAGPSVLGYERPAATGDWIVGPLVASVAIVAWWGATRPLRWANVAAAAWLLAAPFVLGSPWDAAVNAWACAAAIGGLSLVRGGIRHRFGGGWSSVVHGDTEGRLRPVPRDAAPAEA